MKPFRTHSIPLVGFAVASLSNLVATPEDPMIFDHLITPILEARCVACHGEEKQKGKLRMDSFDALTAGGGEGAALVPGNLEDSLMHFRVVLPEDDDEHMPPEGKDQLSPAEVALLSWWIETGANRDQRLSQVLPEMSDQLAEHAREVVALVDTFGNAADASEEVALSPEQQQLVQATMEEVNATGATLMPISQESTMLRFSALNVQKEFGDEQLKALEPVSDRIAWLDLSRTNVTDAGMATVAGMTNLKRLHLDNTAVTDGALGQIRDLKNLDYLNLYGTAVSDAGLPHLHGMSALKNLYLWQTKVTQGGAKNLHAALAGATINLGWQFEEAAKVAQANPAPTPVEAPTEEKPAPAPPAAAPAPTPEPPAANLNALVQRLKADLQDARMLADGARAKSAEVQQMAQQAMRASEAAQTNANQKQTAMQTAQARIADVEAVSAAITAAIGVAEEKKAEREGNPAPANINPLSDQLKASLLASQELTASVRKGFEDASKAATEAMQAATAAKTLTDQKAAEVATATARVADLDSVVEAINAALQVTEDKK